MFRWLILTIAVLLIPAGGVVPDVAAQEGRALSISGATTVQPIAERIAELYTQQNGAQVHVSGGGSGAGLRNAASGASDIGMVSRALREEERQSVQAVTVGYDALVFIVNEANPLTRIDLDAVVRIFSGRITNWNQLAAWDEPVVLISKEVGRATLDLFEGYAQLHHPAKPAGARGVIAEAAFEIGANIEALTLVGGLPGGIGYVSMGAASELIGIGMPIRVLELDGVRAEVASVLSGRYPIGRELNFVHVGHPRALEFLELALSPEGQRIVENEGYIPAGRR